MKTTPSVLLGFLSAIAITALGQTATPAKKPSLVHQQAIVIDTHIDIEGADFTSDAFDPGGFQPQRRFDLIRMRQGGVDGAFLVVFSPQGAQSKAGYRNAHQKALLQFDWLDRFLTRHQASVGRALSPEALVKLHREGKQAIAIGMENGYPIGTDPTRVREYYQRGARYLSLGHWTNNQLCDAATDPKPQHFGLSALGREVVGEMNRLGMMVDVSHSSEAAFWEILRTSRAPLIASHSATQTLTPHPRNLSDEQIRAIARAGGVVQIVAVDDFLESKAHKDQIEDLLKRLGLPDRETIFNFTPEQKKQFADQLAEYDRGRREIEQRDPPPTLKDMVAHIDHTARIAGIDHVGIGSDFDGGGGIPGFHDVSEAENVTLALLERGYSATDIAKIWGGNLLRVWREVERVGRALQSSQAQVRARLQQGVEPLVQQERSRVEAPGLSLAFVMNDEILYQGSFGVQRLGQGTPVTGDTVFHQASVTKTLVGTSIVQLAEGGKLELDDPVVKHVPYFRLADPRYPAITIRQMLSHLSGMPDFDSNPWHQPAFDTGALERFVRQFVPDKYLTADPDTRYEYSNTAYEILGDVIAKVSGQDFESYVSEHILAPLGMSHSTLLKTEVPTERLATPHTLTQGHMGISEVFPYNRMHGPSSTLLASVNDMTSWVRVNLNGGEHNGRKILSGQSLQAMWAPALGTFDEVGLTWHRRRHHGLQIIYHGGSDTGFTSYVLLVPEKQLGIVVCCNTDAWPMRAFVTAILDLALGTAPTPADGHQNRFR